MYDASTTTSTGYAGAKVSAEAGRHSSALASTLGPSRWSNDEFLDGLRQFGDEAADRCAVQLAKEGHAGNVSREVFAKMSQNDSRLPADAPEPLKQFFADTYPWCDRCRQPSLPPWVDRDRLIHGQQVFMTHSVLSVLVLLCKSLPEGYAAAGATKILNISGELLEHTYHRLMGTLSLLMSVSSPDSFERAGTAMLNAQQMRLLHAGVRSNVAPVVLERRGGPGGYAAYRAKHGLPINQEDLLATIMAFSLLVVTGLRTLHAPLSDQEAEDFYYVWRVFAHLMGIHPPGDPSDESHLPESLDEAAAFYTAYCRRQYAGETRWEGDWLERSLAENPDGCQLAGRHLNMLGTVLPAWGSRLIDLKDITHLYTEMLIGEAACARVGIPRLEGHGAMRFLITKIPALWAKAWGRVNNGLHVWASKWVLKSLLDESYARGVVFTVPATLEDLKELVDDGATRRGSMAMPKVP